MKKLWLVLGLLIVIQFIRPSKNESGNDAQSIFNQYPASDEVKNILKVACFDCHSNKTIYPWYAEIQPGGWWLNSHVKGGKHHLNFSEFGTYQAEDHSKIFDEIIETVKEKEMPLKSYTWFGLHKDAKLTDEQRQKITAWAQEMKARIK